MCELAVGGLGARTLTRTGAHASTVSGFQLQSICCALYNTVRAVSTSVHDPSCPIRPNWTYLEALLTHRPFPHFIERFIQSSSRLKHPCGTAGRFNTILRDPLFGEAVVERSRHVWRKGGQFDMRCECVLEV